VILILLLPLAALYFLPAIVAIARGRQVGVVLVLNVFLGWTLLGWIGALALAVSSSPRPRVLIQPSFVYPPYQPNAYPLPYPPSSTAAVPAAVLSDAEPTRWVGPVAITRPRRGDG
jgi:Superinfection immunity protein